jgi:transcription antitermination factor NusG
LQPVPLSEPEIEALRASLTLVATQPHPYLNIGERVRIKSGPLAGLEGIILREGSGLRVVLSLELIMQSIVVEVDNWDLEAVLAKS